MEEKPKQTAVDILQKTLKGVLAGVPYGGGLVSEFFEFIWKPPYSRRLIEWIESIAEDIKKLQEKNKSFSFEDLNRNEFFNTTLFHATQVAIRNHHKEKLEALRNAVLNSISPNLPEEDLQLMFLNWVDELTTWHLRILQFFDSPETWLNKSNIKIPDWAEASPIQVFFHVYPQLKDQDTFFNLLIQDLADLKELLLENKLRSSMQKMAYLRVSHTTNLGKQFLRFITSPIKDNQEK